MAAMASDWIKPCISVLGFAFQPTRWRRSFAAFPTTASRRRHASGVPNRWREPAGIEPARVRGRGLQGIRDESPPGRPDMTGPIASCAPLFASVPRSDRTHAAIDDEFAAHGERRLVRGEEDHRLGDLDGVSEPAERDL